MRQQIDPSPLENGAARGARWRIWVLRFAVLATVSCLFLSGRGNIDLMAQTTRRGDVSGENVPFAPPRPLKPRRDLARADDGRFWRRLATDGLHDRANPQIRTLREPARVLSRLAGRPDESGNNVDWVAALRGGQIAPKDRLRPGAVPERLKTDIIMPRTAAMPMVRFPHLAHTEWLDCSSCHDDMFAKKRGGHRINMEDILNGKYCGTCHGAVAFPPTDCLRCHSVERSVGVAN